MYNGKRKRMKNKGRWSVGILSIMLLLSLGACSADKSPYGPEDVWTNEGTGASGGTEASGGMEANRGTEINGEVQTGAGDIIQNTEGQFHSTVSVTLDDISLDDCPDYVFPTGEGQLLLVGDGLTLLDCNTLEMVKKNRNLGLDFDLRDLSSCKLTVLEEEYILLGNWLDMGEAEALGNGTFMSVSSKLPELKMIHIGKDLQIMEVINMNEVLGTERDISAFVLVEQGRKLVFAEDYNGLYVYDRNTGKRSECIGFYHSPKGTKDGGIGSVYSIQYAEAANQILFTGTYYDSKEKEYLGTVGKVNMDGSGLSYEKGGVNDYGALWYFDGSVLIEDMEFRGPGGVGTAFYYDRNKERHIYSLVDEYTGLQPSEEGNYFAVQSVDWSVDGKNIGYTVRTYALKSGQLIQEIPLPRTEIGEDTVLSKVVICEDPGRILMFLQDRGADDNAHIKAESLAMQQ